MHMCFDRFCASALIKVAENSLAIYIHFSYIKLDVRGKAQRETGRGSRQEREDGETSSLRDRGWGGG